jgi:transcriptional regulator with XRE-family HTH domain
VVTIETMLRLKVQLRAYLDHFDLSAAQLARKSGVSKQTLSYWLAGGEPRKLAQLHKVAQALNTSLDDLCFGEGVATQRQIQKGEPLDLLLGSDGNWISGKFEVEIKLRRLK